MEKDYTFMKSWKTTVCGLIAAVAAYVVAYPATFAKWPWIATAAGIVMASGIAGIGIASKDSTVHSTAAEVNAATTDKAVEDAKA